MITCEYSRAPLNAKENDGVICRQVAFFLGITPCFLGSLPCAPNYRPVKLFFTTSCKKHTAPRKELSLHKHTSRILPFNPERKSAQDIMADNHKVFFTSPLRRNWMSLCTEHLASFLHERNSKISVHSGTENILEIWWLWPVSGAYRNNVNIASCKANNIDTGLINHSIRWFVTLAKKRG